MDIDFIIAFVIVILIIGFIAFICNKVYKIDENINKLCFNISKINSVVNNINEETANNYKFILTNANNIRKLRDTLQYYIDNNNINDIDNIINILNTINKNINSVLLGNNDIVKLINNDINNINIIRNKLNIIKTNTDIILLNVDNNANILKKIINKLNTDKPNCKDRVHVSKKVKAKNSLSNSKAEQTINDNNKK